MANRRTAQGTTRIRASSSSGRLTAFRGRVVFTTPENNAQRFWITDGTPAGTRPFSTTTFDYVGPLAATEDKVFFLGGTRATGTEPHVMDTNGVGRLIKDVFPGSRAGAFILWGTANGRMFFRGRDANQTLSVWATDGTTAGTFSFQEEVRYFSSTPERAFFVPFRTGGIVASDGTPAGTVRASTGGSALAASGTGCYFVRREVSGGYVLMHFDARTGAVSSFCVTLPDHAGSSSQASWLRVAGSRLFFDGTHPVLGRELHAYRIVQPYSVSLGGACGANRATLRAQPPVLGQSMRFDVTESPMGVGALILGAPLSSPLPLPASAPCGMQLNLAGAAGIGGSSNRDWSVSFALPFRRELIGQAVNAQAFFIVPGPRLAEASNAVRLQLGN